MSKGRRNLQTANSGCPSIFEGTGTPVSFIEGHGELRTTARWSIQAVTLGTARRSVALTTRRNWAKKKKEASQSSSASSPGQCRSLRFRAGYHGLMCASLVAVRRPESTRRSSRLPRPIYSFAAQSADPLLGQNVTQVRQRTMAIL